MEGAQSLGLRRHYPKRGGDQKREFSALLRARQARLGLRPIAQQVRCHATIAETKMGHLPATAGILSRKASSREEEQKAARGYSVVTICGGGGITAWTGWSSRRAGVSDAVSRQLLDRGQMASFEKSGYFFPTRVIFFGAPRLFPNLVDRKAFRGPHSGSTDASPRTPLGKAVIREGEKPQRLPERNRRARATGASRSVGA